MNQIFNSGDIVKDIETNEEWRIVGGRTTSDCYWMKAEGKSYKLQHERKLKLVKKKNGDSKK